MSEEPLEPFTRWMRVVNQEKKHYKLFNGVELNDIALMEMWKQGLTPIEALNDLSTIT